MAIGPGLMFMILLYVQGWAKVGKSGLVRLIGKGWMICLVGGCGCTCKYRGGCGWLRASLGRYGQGWAGLDWSN